MRFRGRSGRDVSGDHAGLRPSSVAVMGAAADPDRGWTFHDLDAEALGALSRAMQSAAARLSESARLLRLG
jgi:hypothetical protein